MAALSVLAAACSSSRSISETGATSSECTQCHGYPPPPFVTTATTHPQATDCHSCHPGTVETDNVTLIPASAGGLHLNGHVDVAGAPHPMPFVADHPPAALADIASCQVCHGTDYGGGSSGVSCNGCHASSVSASAPDWKTNCTFCHGTRTANVTTATAAAAPPVAVDRSTNAAKVGAHQAHLVDGALRAALPCSTCHAVPTDPLGHFTGGAATIAFDALASQGVASPAYAGSGGGCAVYCHGSGSSWPAGSVAASPTPAWTSTGLACNACHASRPSTGRHTSVSAHGSAPCAYCHLGYTQDRSVDASIHVDGARTVRFPTRAGPVLTLANPGWTNCTNCHDTGPNGNANAPGF